MRRGRFWQVDIRRNQRNDLAKCSKIDELPGLDWSDGLAGWRDGERDDGGSSSIQGEPLVLIRATRSMLGGVTEMQPRLSERCRSERMIAQCRSWCRDAAETRLDAAIGGPCSTARLKLRMEGVVRNAW